MRKIAPGDSALAARLKRELRGEVLFDAASRGRYATDASIYQIEPIGVVVPRTEADALAAFRIAIDEGVPVLPRGGGTSQCGQTVGAALVIDHSRHLNEVLAFDKDARTVTVQPGVVLDQLNAYLKPHGLVVSRRRFHQRPGDARRDGRQQFVRLALDPLRQHGA
jgi:FAD/FMN-containing dehydrogenase